MSKPQWIRLSVVSLWVGAACASPMEEQGPEAVEVADPGAVPAPAPSVDAVQQALAATVLPSDAWVRQPGSTGEDRVWGMATAPGGVYAAGYTCGNLEGGQVSSGGCDAFLIRYDAAGANPRVHTWGTSADDRATSVAACPDGTVYVAGTTRGSIGPGTADAVGGSFFVTQFDANGTRQTTMQAGTPAAESGLAVAVDCARSRVYVAGQTHGSLPGSSAMGEGDAFLVQYIVSGTTFTTGFVRQLGSARSDQAQAVAVDADGDVYVAGTTYGALNPATVAGGPPDSTNLDASGLTGDVFVARYDLNGALQDLDQQGTALNDNARGLALLRTAAGTQVYVAGTTEGALDGQTNKGGYDALLLRYAAAASPKTLQWAATRQEGGAGHEFALGLAASADGLLYLTGQTSSDLSTGALNNPLSDDVFLVKFDHAGNRLGPTHQLDSIRNPNDPAGIDEVGHGVAVDGDSNVYVGGSTEWQLGGNTNKGSVDAVVARFIDGCPLNATARSCTNGTSWGDPHFITFDGPTHHFQGAGDFIGVKQADGTPEFLVQARQCPVGSGRQVATNRVVATKLGADTLVFQDSNALPLLVRPATPDTQTEPMGFSRPVSMLALPPEVQTVSLTDGATRLLSGGALHRKSASEYVVRWWTGERLRVKLYSGSITYTAYLPEARRNNVQGLLGNNNGVGTDDAATPANWRVSSGSLFPTSGLATGDCTNLSFPGPSAPLTTSPYYAEAQSACGAAACVDKESCIEDYVAAREAGQQDMTPVLQACSDVALLPYKLVRLAGRQDDFATADGTESPQPSAVLKTWVNSWYRASASIRNFDTTHSNQVWAHTFTNLQPRSGFTLCGGTLELRTLTGDSNDAMGLPFLDAAGTPVSNDRFFYGYISFLGAPLGQRKTISLDLRQLPGGAGANGPMNVLSLMEERGQLDIYVQDDSGVDYATLTVQYCVK